MALVMVRACLTVLKDGVPSVVVQALKLQSCKPACSAALMERDMNRWTTFQAKGGRLKHKLDASCVVNL
jgi:hypothetical protein